ncbi:hypothetical protein LO749_09535 [Paracoccus denitrificans]|uniref:hypothetical protein n=1 Tax=Paracoccus denitrificans TaxID=266 RepID=UPI001E5719C9|nr:hypothetical protein [Paracoccus denitrificans]UFS64410.1 hypothetical protein LO749_09535 [Paracoccus denitrificans]
MAHFKVDLRTKIIAKDTRVFLARAGKNGHLFEAVLAAKAIGPDLPDLGLDLENGLAKDEDVEAKVKRARALSTWLRRPTYDRGQKPSASLADYRDVAKRSGHAQIEGIVKSYFQDLQAGDLLVIPNPSYFGEALIAEVLPLGKQPTRIAGTRRFDGYFFDGRAFGHFAKVKMASLPRAVIDLAKAPTGFAQVINPAVKHRIFELCYTDYVFDDEFASRILTTKRDFSPFDGNVLNAFVTMVAKNVETLQNGPEKPHLVGLVDAAFIDLGDDDLQVKININSPGYLAIIDRSIVPLVTAALLNIIIAAGFDAGAIAQDLTVEVTNSKIEQALDLCSKEVSQMTQSMLLFMSEEEADFQQTCEMLRRSHESTGATSGVEVKKN